MATLTAEAPAGTGEHKPPAKNRERIKRRRGGRIDESGARYFLVKTSVAAARKTVRNSSVSVTAENCSLARPALALRIRKISQRRTYAKKGNIRATWQPTTRKVPLRWSRSIART